MRRTSPCSPDLTHALDDVDAAFERLYALMARAHALGLVTAAESDEFRRETKRGARNKILSVASARARLAVYQVWTTRLESRLHDDGAARVGEPSESPAHPAESNGGDIVSTAPRATGRATPMRAALGTPSPGLAGAGPTLEVPPGTAKPDVVASASAQRAQLWATVAQLSSNPKRTAVDILRQVGLPVTASNKRWAQRVVRDKRANGKAHDGRTARQQRPPRVLSPDLQDMLRALALEHVKASARGLHQALRRHIEFLKEEVAAGRDISDQLLGAAFLRGQITMPHERTVRRYIRSLGPTIAFIREHGLAEWKRQHGSSVARKWAVRTNEQWQTDNCQLDIWTRVLGRSGEWIPIRPFLTAALDVHSRADMSLVLSERTPDAFTSTHVLYLGMLPKQDPRWEAHGRPETLVMDNGGDFKAHQVVEKLGRVGILPDFCDARAPHQKPHIEAFFGTIQKTLLPTLPGYTLGKDHGKPMTPARVMALMDLPTLRDVLERWVVEDYHTTVHSETGERPIDRWRAGAPVIEPLDPVALALQLLHRDQRKIVRGRIQFTVARGQPTQYWMPVLHEREGRRVELRYNPDDLSSILVYDAETEQYLGEAWDPSSPRSPYSLADIDAAGAEHVRKLAEENANLVQRLPNYLAKSRETDRPRRRPRGEKSPRPARAAAAPAPPPVPTDTGRPSLQLVAVPPCALPQLSAAERLEQRKARLAAAMRGSSAPTLPGTPAPGLPSGQVPPSSSDQPGTTAVTANTSRLA